MDYSTYFVLYIQCLQKRHARSHKMRFHMLRSGRDTVGPGRTSAGLEKKGSGTEWEMKRDKGRADTDTDR